MSHKNKVPLVDQVKLALDEKLAIGQSKYLDKSLKQNSNKIYSWDTYRNYLKHNCYFVLWCKENYKCKTLDQCRSHIDEWLITRVHLSAYTIKLEAAALAKLYNCSTKEFIPTKARYRSEITRSRGKKIRDKHFSEINNQEFVQFCKSTGLRRNELKSLTGDKLIQKDGIYYIKVDAGSKGGRHREVPIIGDVDFIVARMMNAGLNKVWNRLPSGADIHSYRADYATALYLSHKRKILSIPKKERYCCRGDRKGLWLDKKAMLITSKALGHNRINVIAEHYLSDLVFNSYNEMG